ncbi:Exodeoxyribonuclease V beta chain [Streptomyces sp. KY75]|nr:Exodeoxyribonuclease V beta chain [Streptomyces sp. KY75]
MPVAAPSSGPPDSPPAVCWSPPMDPSASGAAGAWDAASAATAAAATAVVVAPLRSRRRMCAAIRSGPSPSKAARAPQRRTQATLRHHVAPEHRTLTASYCFFTFQRRRGPGGQRRVP